MPDWKKMKAEYIRDETTSFRKMAVKYGVSSGTIGKRASKEKWTDLRKQKAIKRDTKIVEIEAVKDADSLCSVSTVADILLETIRNNISNGVYDMNPQAVKQLTGALKDLKEIKSIKSDADMREQEARIKKLEREATVEETDKDIRIVISSDAEDYCG